MTAHTEAQRERLRALAEKLGFELDAAHVDEALDAARELEETAEQSRNEEIAHRLRRDSVGRMSDDEYSALLDVYEDPRTRTDTGPLTDIDVAVKDVIAVKDLRMTCGSVSFSCVPLTDAAVVDRLLDAGVRLVGKANTDAFAFGPTGEFSELRDVVNPAAEDRVPGGSSSGSAASVAGDLVDTALGTDTGGSVRLPAACCGVVGVKPTHTLVPRDGFVDLAPSTDTIGPLARDVETAARVLDVMAGGDARDRTSAVTDPGALVDELGDGGGLSIGVPTSFLDVSTEAVTGVIRDLATDLEGREEVEATDEVNLPLGDIDNAYPLTIAAEFAWLLRQSGVVRGQGTKYSEEWRQIFSMFRDSLNIHIAMRVLPAAYLDDETQGLSYVAARSEALAFERRLDDLFQEYDVLLVPTLRVLPPERGEITATEGLSDVTGNTGPFSLVGNPAVSVPAGEVDGIPVGVQVIAPRFEDGTALEGANLVEKTIS
jgi:Asp-tRNA(Asn)/Glu-tRNA(Gln) amidotransferase A subunit family amidase